MRGPVPKQEPSTWSTCRWCSLSSRFGARRKSFSRSRCRRWPNAKPTRDCGILACLVLMRRVWSSNGAESLRADKAPRTLRKMRTDRVRSRPTRLSQLASGRLARFSALLAWASARRSRTTPTSDNCQSRWHGCRRHLAPRRCRRREWLTYIAVTLGYSVAIDPAWGAGNSIVPTPHFGQLNAQSIQADRTKLNLGHLARQETKASGQSRGRSMRAKMTARVSSAKAGAYCGFCPGRWCGPSSPTHCAPLLHGWGSAPGVAVRDKRRLLVRLALFNRQEHQTRAVGWALHLCPAARRGRLFLLCNVEQSRMACSSPLSSAARSMRNVCSLGSVVSHSP